ncbi:MAG: hypothetical protein AABX01_01080 [Candidatus Micrarchaeota archaeon]
MATDEEILQLWEKLPKKKERAQDIVRLYRLAESAGRQEAVLALEKELLLDATIESALKTFGWGRNSRASIITTRALLREAARIAIMKVGK